MREDVQIAFENALQFDLPRGKRDARRFKMLLVSFLRDLPEDMTVLELVENLEDGGD